MSQVGYSTVTCTLHFKPDAETPWVTKESNILIHYWFNPRRIQTLLEVAETIEAWASREYTEEIQQTKASINEMCCCFRCCLCIDFNEIRATVTKMEIRGISYDRGTMALEYDSDCFHDAEPITLKIETCGNITICQCCTREAIDRCNSYSNLNCIYSHIN